MVIPVQCENCNRAFEVSDDMAGQRIKCACGQILQVADSSAVMDFLSQEMELRNDPLLAETPADWAKATGAPPEVAERIEKKMATKLHSNAGFMMALTGGILAIMLLLGLIAFLMSPR
ncbi:MAG: hypothetical protein JW888_08125 [Pirellulales bacterium]|nr:hypothetical protein [Pirellulales bacterium]